MQYTSFSPDARWDRRMPSDLESQQDFNEKIQVFVLFKDSKIYPKAFIWKTNKHKITKLNFTWQEKCGRETINFFSVQTEANTYQISFNNTSYVWKMEKIIS